MSYQQSLPYGRVQSHDAGSSADRLPKEEYQLADAQQAYGLDNEFRPAAKSHKKLWWILGGVLLLAAIVGGVVGGVVASKNSNKSSGSSNSSQSGSGGNSSSTSNGSDPSKFTLNPALKRSFFALAYSTPLSANYPNCGDTIDVVIPQMQLMSQLTTRLRTYGADCQQSELILQAIRDTKVDMKVYLGIYMDANSSVYQRQLDTTLAVLKEFGPDNVLGISVGNEYILGQMTAGTSTQATAEALVLSNVADTKKALTAAGYSIPVGSGDAGEYITETYAAGLDFVFSNNHPFFAGVSVDLAAGWTYDYITTDKPASALLAPNKPTLWQGEVGWPSAAMAGGSLTLNGSIASIPNMQTMLDNYVCSANKNVSTIPYVWFQSFDMAQNDIYGGVEPYWGLFDKDNKFKDGIVIPDCVSP